jgi:hypothetical protein
MIVTIAIVRITTVMTPMLTGLGFDVPSPRKNKTQFPIESQA